jgi:hypothetical protein
VSFLHAVVSHTGSHHEEAEHPILLYTYVAYPHDILRWPDNAAFYYLHPQTLPSQEHVTNIGERPNDMYISNYNYAYNTTLKLIPVAARTDAGRSLYDFELVYANHLFGNPIGLRVEHQTKNTTASQSAIRYTMDHVSLRGYIFETSGQNFDAWFLNDYTL